MSSTVFTDQVTPIVAAWLNDVNAVAYGATTNAAAATGAGAVGYNPTVNYVRGTLGWSQANQRRWNVTEYPWLAKFDGVTDDTSAIQACFSALYNAGGGTMVFPAGTALVTSVVLTWAAALTVNIEGAGIAVTALQKTGASTTPVLDLVQSVGVLDTYSKFSNFSVIGNAKSGHGIRATLLARCATENVKVTVCDVGLELVGSLIWDHYNLNTNSCNIGVRTRKSGGVYANLHSFYGGASRANSTRGYDIGEASGVHWYGVDIEQNGTTLNTATGNVVIRSTASAESGVANMSMNGGWCEASFGSNFVVEAASGLNLTIKDTILAAAEAHLSMTVGAIQSLNLISVQAAGSGDTITTAAVNCTVVGGNINVLADTATSYAHLGVTNNSAVLNEFGGSSGKLSLGNGAIHTGLVGVVTTTAVAATAFSAASAGIYFVYSYLANAGTIYQATARIVSDGTNVQRIEGTNGANSTITVSGTNVQVTQTSGVGQTMSVVYQKVA